MSQSDDVLDFRIRIHRDENPMLFRAISGLEAAPGMRKRNLFVRQLMEMGLMVMEERMRRQAGLSSRVSSGLADEVTASAMAMTRSSRLPATASAPPESPAEPASATSGQTSDAASAASTPIEAAPPATAPARQIAAVAAPMAGTIAPGDDDRPPPRLAGVRAVRMLDGESFE